MVLYRLRYVVRRVWKLCITPEDEIRIIERCKKGVEKEERRYLYPLIVVSLICDFFFTMLYAPEHAFRYGVGKTLLDAACFFLGYLLVRHFGPKWLTAYTHRDYDSWALSTSILYAFGVLLVVNLLTTIIPGLGYLTILDLFVAYLLWIFAGELLHLQDDDRATAMVVLTLTIYVFPIALSLLMHALFKNFFP